MRDKESVCWPDGFFENLRAYQKIKDLLVEHGVTLGSTSCASTQIPIDLMKALMMTCGLDGALDLSRDGSGRKVGENARSRRERQSWDQVLRGVCANHCIDDDEVEGLVDSVLAILVDNGMHNEAFVGSSSESLAE